VLSISSYPVRAKGIRAHFRRRAASLSDDNALCTPDASQGIRLGQGSARKTSKRKGWVQVQRAVGVHDPRGRDRLGGPVLRACASRPAAWIVVAFWLHLLAKQKVEKFL